MCRLTHWKRRILLGDGDPNTCMSAVAAVSRPSGDALFMTGTGGPRPMMGGCLGGGAPNKNRSAISAVTGAVPTAKALALPRLADVVIVAGMRKGDVAERPAAPAPAAASGLPNCCWRLPLRCDAPAECVRAWAPPPAPPPPPADVPRESAPGLLGDAPP